MKKKEEGSGYYHFLGESLAEQRKLLELNQKEVAAKIKISSSDLSRIENGKKPITETLLFKLCEVYGVPVVTVASEAYDRYQTYLLEKGPKRDEFTEPLPSHPVAIQLLELYDQYTQARNEWERELFLNFVRYMETLRAAS